MADEDETTVRLVRLTSAQRWLLSLAGLSALAAGIAAVFETDNGAGTATLLATGGVFLIVGVAGVLPRTIRFGDAEGHFYEEVLSEAPPEAADALARSAVSSPTAPTSILRAAARYWEFERDAADFLSHALPDRAHLLLEASLPNGRRVDAIVQDGESRVAIEFKWFSTELARQFDVAPIVDRLLNYSSNDHTAALLLSNVAPGRVSAKLLEQAGLRIFVLREGADPGTLRTLLDHLLGAAPRP